MALRRIGSRLAAAVASIAVTGGGCVSFDADAQTLAEDGSDVEDATALLSALAASFAPVTGATLDLSTLAPSVVLYTPKDCVATTLVEGALAVTFHDCDGPWGLAHVSGSVMVSPSTGSQALEISATALLLDRASVTFDATATFESKRCLVDHDLGPRASRARPPAAGADSSGAWSTEWTLGLICLGYAIGESQATVAGSAVAIQSFGLTRCDDACPTAGTLVVSNSAALIDTLSFDGSDVAAFTPPRTARNLELACGL